MESLGGGNHSAQGGLQENANSLPPFLGREEEEALPGDPTYLGGLGTRIFLPIYMI